MLVGLSNERPAVTPSPAIWCHGNPADHADPQSFVPDSHFALIGGQVPKHVRAFPEEQNERRRPMLGIVVLLTWGAFGKRGLEQSVDT
jgi:hypothetical protein